MSTPEHLHVGLTKVRIGKRMGRGFIDYPCFRSSKHLTSRSKSMASGESRSYSFLWAKACCEGVRAL